MVDDNVEVKLARIETKLDIALADGGDHEVRIRRLEKALFTAMGVAAAIGGVLGAIGSKLVGMWVS